MTDVLAGISTRRTPQNQPADPRQVPNNAGGYTFQVTPTQRLRRFLTLGVDGGTYYASAQDLAIENAQVVLDMADTDHKTLVDTIVEVSTSGRAPKQNPALFALAIAASRGTAAEKGYALAVLPQVARTGTHLFLFARYAKQFRGWGRGLRRAISGWYLDRDVDALAYQTVKYRSREGWSHRDLLRLASPPRWVGKTSPLRAAATEPGRRALFDWITHGTLGDHTPRLVEGYVKAQEPGADVPALVREYGLSWEMLPDHAVNQVPVWDALLDRGVPMTALLRQLPRLTRLGVLPRVGGRTSEVCAQLTDPDRLTRARVHPINVLIAARTYEAGASFRGDSTWTPTPKVVDALDAAFYAAFGAVTPTGKRTLLALDVSGSMTSPISGTSLSCREASAALALVTAATEPDYDIVGFTATGSRSSFNTPPSLTPLNITPRQRLADVTRTISDLPFGRTDCALPFRYAARSGGRFETIVTYTDNETWYGEVHPHQALTQYRDATGIPARSIVTAMTATDFTIADPTDPMSLDVAGFDAAVPHLISDFARGDL